MAAPNTETVTEAEAKEAQSVGWDEKLINDFALCVNSFSRLFCFLRGKLNGTN